MKNNVKKDFFWNTLGTAINAFNSLFFMIIATRINGLEEAGIFTYAFSISLLFNIIGVFCGRVFQVTEYSKFTDSDFFWNKVISCLIMLLTSILFILLNGYAGHKFYIIIVLVIYRTMEAFAEVLYAFYQKNNELYKVGISLVMKNIIGLVLFFTIDYLTKNIIISSLALTITYLIIMLVYDFKALKRYNINLKKQNKKNIIKIFKIGILPFLLSFSIQLLVNIPRYIIDLKTTSDISTIWGILIMPASIMILIGQFCLSPFIMELSKLYNSGQIKKYMKKSLCICAFVFCGGLVALLAAWFLGIPVLNFVYNVDLNKYKISFMFIIIGAILYGIQNILYNLLIAMRILVSQIVLYSICILIAIISFYFAINGYGIKGACATYMIIMTALFLSYFILFIICLLNSRKKEEKYEKN